MLGNKRILVTGASGFIGSHLVERLVTMKRQDESIGVFALSRSLGKLESIDDLDDVEFHQCDLLDNEKLEAIVGKIAPHIVFHLASSPDGSESVEHAMRCIQNNIVATHNLAQVFGKSANPEGLIYGDSTKVYGSAPPPFRNDLAPEPNSSYAITKAAGWHFLQLEGSRYGFSSVAIRPTLIFGPRQPVNLISRVFEAAQSGVRNFPLQGGTQTRTPLYIDDAIDAFVLAAESVHDLNSSSVIIGGAEELSVAEIAESVVQCLGSSMVIVREDSMRETDVLRSFVDLSDAENRLGWTPVTRFSDGLVACRAKLHKTPV